MRDIKFRAWYVKEKRFITWDEILANGDLEEVEHPREYFNCNLGDVGSVQQYTGEKDKNRVEIYEGDIIKRVSQYQKYVAPIFISDTKIYVPYLKEDIKQVMWGKFTDGDQIIHGIDCWTYSKFSGYSLSEDIGDTSYYNRVSKKLKESFTGTVSVEVVGNIYENMKLLEVK